MPTQFKKFLLWNKQDMVDEELIFGVVYNTTNQSSLLTRVELELRTKAIDLFNELLPMMGKDVIREKVTHKLHKTAVLLKDKILVAAICFRPCPSKGFSEIVFCGVAEQRRGYGAAIINKFKEFSQANRIKYLLTSADNTAVGKSGDCN